MTSGFRNSAGVDFDDLYDPDVVGDGYTATFLRRSDGTPLRYASASYGTPGDAIGFRDQAGADVGTRWARKGTANYWSVVNMSAHGYDHSTTSGVAVLGNAQFRIVFHANGTLTQEVAGDGPSGLTWSVVNTSTFARGGNPASAYQARLSWSMTANHYTGTGAPSGYINQSNGASAFTSITGDVGLDISNGSGYVYNSNFPIIHGYVTLTVTVDLKDPSGKVTTKTFTCDMDLYGAPQPNS
jgi:hypothetical protein